ncbi:hypothetical protein OHB04_15140 [Streptomyces sp. NBC_01775]|uniref:EamA family transporter n=1 Tax=Streptomyces sp. NBC_01775 TaxID=2975939 RepID=UPI002DDC30ED|nr:hypothetical protein [Streptomyces sp. NBC_01775]WSB76972.1 hypothetical protein OHB04_15140 [Streptomyces sp. NBC_01775]
MRVRRVPPHAYFVISAVFHYLGPAFAVLLFARVQPLGVAWLRIVTAAAVFAVWRRPWRRWRSADRATRRSLPVWGALLAVMNSSFYLALDRLPLGTVAAIEFLPVIALATVAVRSMRNLLALVTAVAGVYLLTDVHLAVEPLGLLFATAGRSGPCAAGSPARPRGRRPPPAFAVHPAPAPVSPPDPLPTASDRTRTTTWTTPGWAPPASPSPASAWG